MATPPDDRALVAEAWRRRFGAAGGPAVLDELRALGRWATIDGPPPAASALAGPRPGVAGAAAAEVWTGGLASFYDLLAPGPRRCVGTACALARGAAGDAPAVGDLPAARCLGRCYEAPCDGRAVPGPIPRASLVAEPVVLRHLLGPAGAGAGAAGGVGAGAGAGAGASAGAGVTPNRGVGLSPRAMAEYAIPSGDHVLAAVEAAGLRGRGGAAFPTAAKWRAARDRPAPARVVVANGDEGDPGAFIDRLLLEEAPHSVLAGMLACARAIGSRHGLVYVRAEYPAAAERMRHAIVEASEVLGNFAVQVVEGAGSYVAGEETALLRSLEGLRAEPSPKPPHPAERGLFGLPTVVQNIETLSVVPWIVARAMRAAGGGALAVTSGGGGDTAHAQADAARGDGHLAVRSGDATVAAGRAAGDVAVRTKAVCVSGAVARPGVFEVELGTPLSRVLAEGAGGPAAGCTWTMALVGGPLGRVVAARDFDVPLSFEALPGMGHAGVVVFDDTARPRALAEHLFAFARAESCGVCTPCRVGTAQLAARTTRASLERLLATIGDGSLCGFGQGVPRPVLDLLAAFGDEVLR